MSGQLGLTRNRTDKYLSYRKAAQRGTRLLVTQNERYGRYPSHKAACDLGAKLLHHLPSQHLTYT